MNDRFKFRVWLGDEMATVLGWSVDGNGTRLEVYREQSCDHLDDIYLHKCKSPLMQCTGLKDCEGKLIYEGDIIINRRSPNSLASEYKWIVEFGEHATSSDYYASRAYGFYARQIGFDDEASLVQIYDEIEIIGNIFKDAHLLEKT